MALPKIQRGLFKFDLEDYHAILGVPADAEAEQIRKRYLDVQRRLHPDRRQVDDGVDEKLADEFLSKLVNPAYEHLFKNKSLRAEHKLLLNQIGQRIVAEGALPPLKSQVARELSTAGEKLDSQYRAAVAEIAAIQFDEVQRIADRIEQLSELNLIFVAHSTSVTPAPTPKPTPQAQTQAPRSGVEGRLQRAKGYIDSKAYDKAVVEMREALKDNPKNARVHATISYAYLRQNQASMARVHAKRALAMDAKDVVAQKVMQELEKADKTAAKAKQPPPKEKKRGFLGGLLGGRRK